MKTKVFLSITFFLFFVLPAILSAQSSFTRNMERSTNSSSYVFFTEATVDSTLDTLYTNVFYGDALTDGILSGRILISSSGTPRVTIVRQSNYFGTWNDVKTLYDADSIKTERASVADTVSTFGQHRFMIFGASGNPSGVSLKWLKKFAK